MKSQTFFLALAALSSVFAAPMPIQERSPKRVVVTVTGKVVEVVHTTSTVWVKAPPAEATATAEQEFIAAPEPTPEPKPEPKPEPVVEEPKEEPKEEPEVIKAPVEPEPTPTPTPAPVVEEPVVEEPVEEEPVEEEPVEEEPVEEEPVEDSSENESTGSVSGSVSTSAFSGEGTFYAPGMGSCGGENTESDSIVAISKDLFAEKDTGNPNTNPLCGQKVKIWGKNSDPVIVTVTDKCMGCAPHDLDMTPTVFEAIGYEQGEGRMPVKWSWA